VGGDVYDDEEGFSWKKESVKRPLEKCEFNRK
jgi:hypothetical protein